MRSQKKCLPTPLGALSRERGAKKEVGFFPMVGDLLHAGHILAIREAAAQCDRLIVGLNVSPEGKNPIQTPAERYLQIAAVREVAEVIPYAGRRDAELLAESGLYTVRFLGDDYREKDWDGKEQELACGIRHVFLTRRHTLSSTELKSRIMQRAAIVRQA